MKNKIRNNIVFWIIIFILIFITAIGLTYAYFISTMKTNPNDKSVTITAGELKLTYYDGNNTIEIENIEPGTTVETKTFSVKNTGKAIINNYGVYIEDVINELKYYTDLDYTLTCKEYDSNNNYVRDCNGNEGDFPIADSLLISNSISVSYTHEYELVIKYVETNKDQSDDMNKTISGKIQIYDLNDIVDINGTLTDYIEGDYITLSSNNKTYKISDDGSFVLSNLEPEYHTITVYSKDNTSKWEITFEITKNTIPTFDETQNLIIINDDSDTVTINMSKGDNQNIILNTVSIDNE